MASGRGTSFGQALVDAIAAMGGGRVGVLKDRIKTDNWHAKLSALTKTRRGYEAAEKAGLSITRETLEKWLSDDQYNVRASYRAQIAKAYEILVGRWPQEVERMTFAITGEVSMGEDVRDRGREGNAALLIDGSQASRSEWEPMRRAWEEGRVDPDKFADDFIVIIEADLGEFSVPPEFSGSDYLVEVS